MDQRPALGESVIPLLLLIKAKLDNISTSLSEIKKVLE
jgi:hypothetical protein